MINVKQEELVDDLVRGIKEKFPEIELVKVTESAEDPNDLWVYITYPQEEEREIQMREFSSDKSMDILLDYGYHISIMPA